MKTPEIAGVLLAAGSAQRFGGNKLLHSLPDGTPVAVAAARTLVQAVPVSIAVVRPGDTELTEHLSALGLRIVENPLATEGMGTSLAAGILATADAAGWIIGLADMPWILPGTIATLADRLRAGASIVAPVHAGQRGHPVGFSSRWRRDLCLLTGDMGARGLLKAHTSLLDKLETDDQGVIGDIDFQADII